jgi:hypothetical protein
MSEIEKPPYKKPIIFFAIIIGLSITILNLININHIIAEWSLSISGLIGVIVLFYWGIIIPIFLIALDIISTYIHEKVADFEYFPLIIGLANAIIGGFTILIAVIAALATIGDGFTPLHLPYIGFYIAEGILALCIAGVAVGALIYGIKIARM